MAFCGKQNSGYEPCLKTALHFLVAKSYEMNFSGCFFFKFVFKRVGNLKVKLVEKS